jgi:hypothetical protein
MKTEHKRAAWLARFAAMLALSSWLTPLHAEYGFDPNFAGNYVTTYFDTLGGPASSRGSKHATLPGGDIVVAGRMRLTGDTTLSPFFNIGLVRYSRQGIRQRWEGTTGPYFWANRDYVVYPNLSNGGSGDTRIESVDDVAYADGRIYVLVTRQYSATPLDRDVALVVFNEDGTFHQSLNVILSSADEVARAIDVKLTGFVAKPVSVSVIAERRVPGPRMVVGKVAVDGSGVLAPDGAFNGGVPVQVPIGTSCAGAPQCNVIAGDLARPFRIFGGDAMPIYVVGAVQRNGADWDYAVAKLAANGTLDASFGLGGVRYVPFDQPGSDLGDFAWAIHVDSVSGPFASDTLTVAGNVRRSCKDGIGVVALTGDGLDLAGFGSNGRIVHGGSAETGTICAQDAAHYASDIARQGNELAIAGTTEVLDQGGTLRTDGALLRIDVGNGSRRGLDGFALFANGESGSSRLRGVLPAGMGRYTLSGEGDVSGFISLYVTTRVEPSDRLYADGFDEFVPQS